jgi:hypothetical protein
MKTTCVHLLTCREARQDVGEAGHIGMCTTYHMLRRTPRSSPYRPSRSTPLLTSFVRRTPVNLRPVDHACARAVLAASHTGGRPAGIDTNLAAMRLCGRPRPRWWFWSHDSARPTRFSGGEGSWYGQLSAPGADGGPHAFFDP